MPAIDQTETKWNWRKFCLLAGIPLLLVVASGFGYRAYRKWQPQRLAAQASAFLAKGDYKSAVLSLNRAIQINPKSIPATRAIAELTDKVGSPDALVWRQRMLQLQPGSLPDILAFVAVALRLAEPETASQSLTLVQEQDKQKPEYQAAAGNVAMAAQEFVKAEAHFQQALAAEPNNDNYRFLHAAAQIHLPDLLGQTAARATLEKLAANPKFHLPSLRVIVRDLISGHQPTEALRRSRDIDHDPHAGFEDHLVQLDLLFATQDDGFSAHLVKVRAEAAQDPRRVGEVLIWLGRNGLAREGVDWARGLPPEVTETYQAGPALANCYVTLRRWEDLSELVKNHSWRQLDFLRRLYLARALREQGNNSAFLAEWGTALSGAAQKRETLIRLAEVVQAWEWPGELRELLWTAVKQQPDPLWALQLLHRQYADAHDTAGLHQVLGRIVQFDPSNDEAKNNFAMLSLLLKSSIDRAASVAQELYLKNPKEPAFVSTYAYALHLRGHSEEALQLMSALPPQRLEQPSIAAYYGLLLTANGFRDKAATYLDLAKAADLLPEEKELVADALK